MKFKFKKPVFKSKEEKHREKLLQDYKDGKVLKIEVPNPNHNNQKKKHKKGRN